MRTAHVFCCSYIIGTIAACGGTGSSDDVTSDPEAWRHHKDAGITDSGVATGVDSGTGADSGAAAIDSGSPDTGALNDAGAVTSSDASVVCNGQCLYVRAGASGTGTGEDWTNAYPTLPSTLQRGYVYFVADGSYGSYTFDDAASGTALITIRKATAASHGTDTGWQDAYGAGQAVFTHWDVYTDYYDFDGGRRNANWQQGATDQYGIKVSGTGPLRIDDGAGTGADHVTFEYIDFQGGGRDTGDGDDVVYGLTGNSNITFRSCALHDSDRTIFLMRGNWQNLTVDHSYLARNTSTPAVHGEMLSMTDSTNVTWSYNVMEDIEGTAFIAGLNDGVASGWKIYGNVALHSAAYVADTGRQPGHSYGVAGFVFVANDSSQQNVGNDFLVVGNTFYNIQGLWSGVVIQVGTGNTVQNNVWYGSVRTANSAATDFNWYYDTVADNAGPHDETCASNCAVLVDPAHNDFHLVRAVGTGASWPAPFDRDGDGIPRGADGVWDKGAYEFR